MPLAAITVLDRHNQPMGPFTLADVQKRLQTGEFKIDQLAFAEGLADWTSLNAVLAHVSGPLVLPPAQIAPPSLAAAATLPEAPQYAGFWLRFVACIIDTLLLALAIYGPIALAVFLFNPHGALHDFRSGSETAMDGVPFWFKLVILPYCIFLPLLYFILTESGPHQATPGKRLLRLYVVDLQGRRISPERASGRTFAKILSNFTCFLFYIGYLMTGFTARKQALHDFIAGTLVLRR